ncbi:MAG: rod-binding protein [Microvirga sp.]|nr:rod-binding protein [Microvirga sp.]
MISPSTDIILEVARAADPGRMAAATERLVGFAAGGGPDAGAFAQALGEADGRRAGSTRSFDQGSARVALQNRALLGHAADSGPAGGAPRVAETRALTPHQQFEAFVLRNFVETMLPDDSSAAFGSGTAGDIWKGMLADKIADEMARAGGIGIAEQLARSHPDGGAERGERRSGDDARSDFFTGFWRAS